MIRNMPLTHRKEINLYEAVQKSFPKILIKDLQKNERICPVCNGLGIRIVDNVYGIEGDTSEAGKRELLPYKRQALSFCRSCYNGVQQLCPYCGQPYRLQGHKHCDCDGQKKADEKERIKKWKETLSKAKQVDEKDVNNMLYCEEFGEYYYDVDDFFDSYAANYDDEYVYTKPDRLWVTSEQKIFIDAADVIENACYELHEDASEQCDEESLQKLLDDWCKEQGGTTTYYPCFKEYVMIDWSKFRGGEQRYVY